MKRIHFTEVALVVLLTCVSIFGVSKCSTANKTGKDYEKALKENTALKKNMSLQSKENDSLLVGISKLTSSIESEKQLRSQIEASYAREKAKLIQTSPQDLLTSLIDSVEGKPYEIDSAGIYDYGVSKMELKECKEVATSLFKESFMLMKAIDGYATVNGNLSEDLVDCTSLRIDLEEEVLLKDADNRKLKGKIWNNRSIAGTLGVILILVVII